MRFWQSIAFLPMEELESVAIAAENMGFEGVGLAHHLITPEKIDSPYPYTEDGNIWWDPRTPFPDPLVTAAVLGSKTERLKFITSILILPLFEPLAIAKAVSTAGWFLGDRLCLGVAAGWLKEEYDAVGIPFESRGERLDEILEALDALVTGEMTEYRGRHFEIPRVQMSPVPRTRVPRYGGGHSNAALRRSVQLDGWFSSGPYDEEGATAILTRIRRIRGELGLLDRDFDCIIGLTSAPDHGLYDRMEALGATSVVVVPSYYLGDASPTLSDRLQFMEDFSNDFIK